MSAKDAVLGTIAERLVRHSNCNVLLAGGPVPKTEADVAPTDAIKKAIAAAL